MTETPARRLDLYIELYLERFGVLPDTLNEYEVAR